MSQPGCYSPLAVGGFGWRASFVVIPLLDVLWFICSRMCVTKKLGESRRVSVDKTKLIDNSRSVAEAQCRGRRHDVRLVLCRTRALALGAGLFRRELDTMRVHLVATGLPDQRDARRLEVPEHHHVDSVVLRAIGHFGCGLLGDVVYRCLDDPIKTRKLATTIPFDLSDVAVLNITLTGSLTATVGLIVASLLLLTGSCQSNWAIQREIQPLRRQRGVGDFIYFLSNLSWIVGPALTGRPPDSVLPRLLQRAYVWRSDRFAGVLAMLLSIRSRSAVTIPVAAQPSN